MMSLKLKMNMFEDDKNSESETLPDYVKITSSRCNLFNNAKYDFIMTPTECNAAAVALNMPDTTYEYDERQAASWDPKGCYYENSRLKLNAGAAYQINSGGCSTWDQCICKKKSVPGLCWYR